MHQCAEYIEKIYTNQRVNKLIAKIEPVDLQDDLKQEMAIVLLSYDCKRIKELYDKNELVKFAMGIIWKMGTKQKGYFYKTYRKRDFVKAYEYLKSQSGKSFLIEKTTIATNILDTKLRKTPNDAHESMIFSKYIELRNCMAVAKYFGIPHLHVFKVVNKTKSELKRAINNSNE